MSSEDDLINEARLQGAARGLSEQGLIAVAWSGVALGCCFTLLRCYVRLTESRRFYADDYWLLSAFGFLFANAILQTLQAHSLYYLVEASSGLKPGGEAMFAQGNIYVRYQFVIIVLFWTITWCVKYSFLALYYRLFNGLAMYRKLWWAVAIFTGLAYVGCWITSVWTCHPPSTYFQFGQCSKPIDIEGSVISISYTTAVDVLTDLMIMALPIKLLTLLHVTRAQKAALVGIFSVGGIVIVCALIRLTQIVSRARSDPVGLAVWGLVEGSMSVIVGSLPALKSFFGRAWDRTVKRRPGHMGSSGENWNVRDGLGRMTISNDREKSNASASGAPKSNNDTERNRGDWSPEEHSPSKRTFPGDYDDEDRILRTNSSSTADIVAAKMENARTKIKR